jgi:hypothetical protein
MAINANEVPITRDDVFQWIQEARDKKVGKEDYIRSQIDALELPDRAVDVSQRDDVQGAQIDVADLVVADLESYG